MMATGGSSPIASRMAPAAATPSASPRMTPRQPSLVWTDHSPVLDLYALCWCVDVRAAARAPDLARSSFVAPGGGARARAPGDAPAAAYL